MNVHRKATSVLSMLNDSARSCVVDAHLAQLDVHVSLEAHREADAYRGPGAAAARPSRAVDPSLVANVDPVKFQHALHALLDYSVRQAPLGGRVDLVAVRTPPHAAPSSASQTASGALQRGTSVRFVTAAVQRATSVVGDRRSSSGNSSTKSNLTTMEVLTIVVASRDREPTPEQVAAHRSETAIKEFNPSRLVVRVQYRAPLSFALSLPHLP